MENLVSMDQAGFDMAVEPATMLQASCDQSHQEWLRGSFLDFRAAYTLSGTQAF